MLYVVDLFFLDVNGEGEGCGGVGVVAVDSVVCLLLLLGFLGLSDFFVIVELGFLYFFSLVRS